MLSHNTTYEIEGKPVLIESGYYLDPIYRRVSNFWHGHYVNPDGSLGEEWSGYGGRFKEIKSSPRAKFEAMWNKILDGVRNDLIEEGMSEEEAEVELGEQVRDFCVRSSL